MLIISVLVGLVAWRAAAKLDVDKPELFCSIGCMKTTASSLADVATAFGYNTSAKGKASVAMGVNSRTVSDAKVPGGSSCGGCVSMGLDTTTIGDWSTAMNSQTIARGYASTAMGHGTAAYTFGEVTLGLFTESGDLSEEQRRNQSVIPTFHEDDAVLRVGIGCPKDKVLPAGGFGCKTAGPLDALRVYKSGALYLKKANGKVVPDVQDALEKCQLAQDQSKRDLDSVKEELKAAKRDHEETKQEVRDLKHDFESTKLELEKLKRTLAELMGKLTV